MLILLFFFGSIVFYTIAAPFVLISYIFPHGIKFSKENGIGIQLHITPENMYKIDWVFPDEDRNIPFWKPSPFEIEVKSFIHHLFWRSGCKGVVISKNHRFTDLHVKVKIHGWRKYDSFGNHGVYDVTIYSQVKRSLLKRVKNSGIISGGLAYLKRV